MMSKAEQMSTLSPSIVVTGIGLITPLGCSREKTWSRVKAGGSIVAEQSSEDLGEGFSPFFRSAPFVNSNGIHRIFPLAFGAAAESLADSNADLSRMDPERVGCSVSVSKPILPPVLTGISSPDSVGNFLARKLKISGPMQNLVAACATGIHSLLIASRWLKEKKCDLGLAGSVESSLNPLIISGFKKMGVLSSCPRPFDRRRDGFMMAEGAGILVLERAEDASRRGARIYARLLACSVGSDFSHPTSFAGDGSSIASVIRRAIANSGIFAEDIDYVNLHGTGTPANDAVETRAVKSVFGKGAYEVSCSSTKSSTGHLLGAAGSLEAGLACLAIRDKFVPPTANLEEEDPLCDLDYTPNKGRNKEIDIALSLSFGFGGPIGAVLFQRA